MSTPMNCPETNAACEKACATACEKKMAGTETVFGGFDNDGKSFQLPDPLIAEQLTVLRAKLDSYGSALHRCYAATGEEAGDIDDFRALQERERHVVDAVKQQRADLDNAETRLAEVAAERGQLLEQKRALSKMADNDSWSRELQDALDAIPARFLANDYWVEGIRRMSTTLSATERKLKDLLSATDALLDTSPWHEDDQSRCYCAHCSQRDDSQREHAPTCKWAAAYLLVHGTPP